MKIEPTQTLENCITALHTTTVPFILNLTTTPACIMLNRLEQFGVTALDSHFCCENINNTNSTNAKPEVSPLSGHCQYTMGYVCQNTQQYNKLCQTIQ